MGYGNEQPVPRKKNANDCPNMKRTPTLPKIPEV